MANLFVFHMKYNQLILMNKWRNVEIICILIKNTEGNKAGLSKFIYLIMIIIT